MDAQVFLRSLCEVLPANYPPRGDDRRGRHAYWGGDWTAWMTERLHDVARGHGLSCCCEKGLHTEAFEAVPGRTRGYAKEYQFDLTWYRRWGWNSLPDVIIEHENVGSWAAFLADHWKLMLGYAPLRVSFGYNADVATLVGYCDKLNATAREAEWRFPAECADLTLLGHKNMAPRDFRVLHRPPGASEWRDLGRLEAAVRAVGA